VTTSHKIMASSNKLATTSNKVARRLLYNDGIVPTEEVEYYVNELSRMEDATEIVLLLCVAGDMLDNILENPIEESKDRECGRLIELALGKLEEKIGEIDEKNPLQESRASITCFKETFTALNRDFAERRQHRNA